MALTLPTTMRAMKYSSTWGGMEKNLTLDDKAPMPNKAANLPKDSVLVKVEYSSLNIVDVKVPESTMGRLLPKPAIPASDYAGTVVRSNLAGIEPGDGVFGALPLPTFGALAEYAVATGPEMANKIPPGLSKPAAATIGVAGLTAYQSIAPFVKQGSRVLINGASGGCGTFQIQIAKHLGCRVTAVCSAANGELCKSLGADEVIDYRSVDLVEHLKQLYAGEKNFDLIVDNIFTAVDLFWQAHYYLATTGRFVTIALRPTLEFGLSFMAVKTMPAILGGGKRPFELVLCKPNTKEFAMVASLIAEGSIRPVIEETLAIEDSKKGYETIKSGRTRGKIVIKVS